LICKGSQRTDFWKRIKKIGLQEGCPLIIFETFDGGEIRFGRKNGAGVGFGYSVGGYYGPAHSSTYYCPDCYNTH
jgi:hypothetical protein